MAGIFISYRREDTSGEANHLAADLRSELGESDVFIDIDAIAPGVDFIERIDRALQSCDLVLVMIGDRWLSAEDAEGRRRIELDDDFVRTEIAKALARTDVRVVPVLVDDARMPTAAELPPEISGLARINAIELSSRHWRYDVEQIIRLATAGGLRGAVRRLPAWFKVGLPVAALVVAVAIVATVVAGGGGSDGAQRLVLSPATVPPVVDECTQQLQIGADGTAGPLTCEGGKINQLAWQYYAGHFDSLALSLGPNADPQQVGHALCSDLETSTYPIVGQIYKIAELYYGWQFGIDPVPSAENSITQC